MGLSCGCTLLERGRRRSVYTPDEVMPFLSLVGNARFEPICVAPLLCQTGAVVRFPGHRKHNEQAGNAQDKVMNISS